MVEAKDIRERMTVEGADGGHVGIVDHVEGTRIKLTRDDPGAGGKHHYLHIDMVAGIRGDTVVLTRTARQAQDEWGVKSVGGDSVAERSDEIRGVEPGSSRAGP
ncbi:DUF2171 domain-containing protein [Jiella sp. M17.18]|uniref:DUF2171 domain-containing protein n=1 Tax=Jiella sp. M17.18 TaxID=3234247 RepID=UPI0034DECB41